MLRRLSPQRLLIAGLLLGLALAAARFLAVQGWIWPVRIVSGSMANRLIGEHFALTCADCGFLFKYGVDSRPPDDRAVCPNCGFERNIARAEWRGRGDRVMIDRGAYLFDPPRRFDLVAFRDPRLPARLVVKRVVGLPGEQVTIRQGDLYLSGKLSRKSLKEFSRSAILVHDNAHQPQSVQRLPARWRSDLNQSAWKAQNDGFHYTPTAGLKASGGSADAEVDWLTYHHWRCYASPYPRAADVPVADNYGYNQGESRQLLEVTDLVASFRLRMPSVGEITLRIHDGRQWCSIRLNSLTKRIDVTRADRKLMNVSFHDAEAQPLAVEFGLIDQQIVLSLNEVEIIRMPYEPGDDPLGAVAQPISIGGFKSEFEISNLVIHRDVYYLDPWCVGQTWSMPRALGQNEYFVLGDNPPLSDDCRRWTNPALSRDAITGRVIPLPR